MNLIESFLNSKDIYISKKNQIKIDYSKLGEKEIMNHLKLMGEFHNRVSNNHGVILLNVNSEIGKQYESYKVLLKKFKRNYFKIKELKEDNVFYKAVIKYGEKIIKKGLKTISQINYDNYISLIKRSMKKNEICLGNPFLENIYEKEKIYINNIEGISFNLVENDAIAFINKLIKKKVNINLDCLIETYLEKMNLDNKSKEYITLMINFPIEPIKIFERKIYNKKEWSDEEALRKFMLSIEKLNI